MENKSEKLIIISLKIIFKFYFVFEKNILIKN